MFDVHRKTGPSSSEAKNAVENDPSSPSAKGPPFTVEVAIPRCATHVTSRKPGLRGPTDVHHWYNVAKLSGLKNGPAISAIRAERQRLLEQGRIEVDRVGGDPLPRVEEVMADGVTVQPVYYVTDEAVQYDMRRHTNAENFFLDVLACVIKISTCCSLPEWRITLAAVEDLVDVHAGRLLPDVSDHHGSHFSE